MPEDEFYKSLPKKRVAAGTLFFNAQNELLLLKPSYKDGWTIPGGVVEEIESPRQGAIREIKEEIGLDIPALEFLCVNHVVAPGVKGVSLQFLFYGGVLSEEQIKNIKLQTEEIVEYKFVDLNNASEFLPDIKLWRFNKCMEALKNKTAIYLDDEDQ